MAHKIQPGSYAATTAQGAEDFKKLEELFGRTKKAADLTEDDKTFLTALMTRIPSDLRGLCSKLLQGQYRMTF